MQQKEERTPPLDFGSAFCLLGNTHPPESSVLLRFPLSHPHFGVTGKKYYNQAFFVALSISGSSRSSTASYGLSPPCLVYSHHHLSVGRSCCTELSMTECSAFAPLSYSSVPYPKQNPVVQYSFLSIFCLLFLLIFGDCILLRFFLILHRFQKALTQDVTLY